MTLGQRIRKKRMDERLELEELADRLGTSPATISNGEHDRRVPRPGKRGKLDEWLVSPPGQALNRDPRHDPQAGDVLDAGETGRRLVLGVTEGRVHWAHADDAARVGQGKPTMKTWRDWGRTIGALAT